MTDFSSFSRDENELAHKFRNDLNHAESTEDVKKFFTYTVQDLLVRVVGDSGAVHYDDIGLTTSGYTLSARLQSNKLLNQALDSSDLKAILQRFADSAQHRTRHLEAHPAKTQANIRGH